MTGVKQENNPLITLTTDFGQSDGYVGAMQGVILTICPIATIVNISHYIPPQNIQTGAFVLYQIYRYYPEQAVHCAVVDPGVGSQRQAVAVRTDHGTFVGPDNGIFSLVLNSATLIEAVALVEPEYQTLNISSTFHGRDIFAPAAAHIAAGVPLNKLGPSVKNLIRTDFRSGIKSGQSKIIHIDHFGNLILDITASDITNTNEATFAIGNTVIKSLHQTFADVDVGQLLAYVGSSYNHIEIAMRNGNAAQALDLQLGDVVQFQS